MSGIMYGYARVSTRGQHEDRQLAALKEFGVATKDIVVEKQSGKNFDRPLYQALVELFRPGDVLVVKSIDRLGRNYDEILEQWSYITKTCQAAIVVLDMPLLDTREGRDLTGTLVADIVLQLLSYVAQTEREFIHQRQALRPRWSEGSALALTASPCRRRSRDWQRTGGKDTSPPPTRAGSWASHARPSPAGPRSGARRRG